MGVYIQLRTYTCTTNFAMLRPAFHLNLNLAEGIGVCVHYDGPLPKHMAFDCEFVSLSRANDERSLILNQFSVKNECHINLVLVLVSYCIISTRRDVTCRHRRLSSVLNTKMGSTDNFFKTHRI